MRVFYILGKFWKIYPKKPRGQQAEVVGFYRVNSINTSLNHCFIIYLPINIKI